MLGIVVDSQIVYIYQGRLVPICWMQPRLYLHLHSNCIINKMANTALQPNNPTDWQKYATSDAMTAIPLRDGNNVNDRSVRECPH